MSSAEDKGPFPLIPLLCPRSEGYLGRGGQVEKGLLHNSRKATDPVSLPNSDTGSPIHGPECSDSATHPSP